jgi:mannitol/fructose-specific phosphotransferase system IIA component (Ntr-type)
MRLTEFLEPDLVVIGLSTSGVEDTIASLVDRLAETGHVDAADAVRRAVVDRERSHTTSLGNGVALPHATVREVERPLILVATAPNGIEFGPAVDGQGVDRLFFLLLSPVDAAGTHIKILARIVRLVRNTGFVDTLIGAESGAALVAEIEREDALHV